MRLSNKARWVLLLAVGWATSAWFALGNGAPGPDAVGAGFLAFCLCFAARTLGRAGRQRAIVSFVALVLPLQGMAGVSIQTRGPAHFHSGSAQHSHRHVEHHHHSHGTDAVSMEQGQPFPALAILEESKRLDAAAALIALPMLALASVPVRCRSDHRARLHCPDPHERPPRI